MHPVRKCSGYLVIFTLLAAPFLHGGTTDEAIRALSWALFAASALWLAGLAIERRAPRIPRIILVCVLLLLAQGWFMAMNAKSVFDRDFLALVERPVRWTLLPGSVDLPGSIEAMQRLSALLLLLVMIADFSRSTRWVRRFTYAMAAAGVVFAVFGVWQKISRNPFPVWSVEKPPPAAFGTFWYHGNAASLLNMTWPLALIAAIWAFRGERSHLAKAGWTAGTAAILGAVAMNSSKGGHLIAAGLALVLVATLLLRLRSVVGGYGWKHFAAFSGLIACVLVLLIVGTDTATSAKRWMEFFGRAGSDSRLGTARVCLEMLPGGGVFGSGPGTFIASFQSHVARARMPLEAVWKFAHNDWIQYFVEWGFFGGAVWLALWWLPVRRAAEQIGLVGRSGFRLEGARSRGSRERWHRSLEALRRHLLFGAGLALAGVLVHALMDFPLQIMSLQIYALTLAGMLVASNRQDDDSEGDAV